MMKYTTSNFDAETFVANLITNGVQVSCDCTNDKFNEYQLPDDFDEQKFKRGQKFYNDNIFALFMSKLAGLITILSVPSILEVLIFTNMSSTHLTAYKRYMATIFHLNIWYMEDFKPGSTIWKSIQEVRRKHNVASQRISCTGANRISQFDMAATQFGFIGYALSHSVRLGLYDAEPAAMKCWVYMWRIIGGLMGIEDQFNICRDSVEETRDICKVLVDKYFKARLEEPPSDFLKMTVTLVESLTVWQPFMRADLAYVKILNVVAPDGQKFKDEFAMLTRYQLFWYDLEVTLRESLKYKFWRWFHNMTMHVSLWLMKNFPFLALWRYGAKHGYVRILNERTPSLRKLYPSG